MHAASVYPEPGSNSLKISSRYLVPLQSFRASLFALLTCVPLGISMSFPTRCTSLESTSFCFVFLVFRCSILKVRFPCRFFATACLFYHIASRLSSTFSNFFEKLFDILRSAASPLSRLVYLTTFFLVCQAYFFDKITRFFAEMSSSDHVPIDFFHILG